MTYNIHDAEDFTVEVGTASLTNSSTNPGTPFEVAYFTGSDAVGGEAEFAVDSAAKSLNVQGDITGVASAVSGWIDFGTRSMTPAPIAAEVSNRIAMSLHATGQFGVDATDYGRLVDFSLTGDTDFTRLININHTNTGSGGESSAIRITTAITDLDKGAGIVVENFGYSDGIYIAAAGTAAAQATTQGPTGIGITVNGNQALTGERNSTAYYGCSGISMAVYTSTGIANFDGPGLAYYAAGVGIGLENINSVSELTPTPLITCRTNRNAISVYGHDSTNGTVLENRMITVWSKRPFDVSGSPPTQVRDATALECFTVTKGGSVRQYGATGASPFYLSKPISGAGFGFLEFSPVTTTGSDAVVINRHTSVTADNNYEQLLIGTDSMSAGYFNVYSRKKNVARTLRPIIIGMHDEDTATKYNNIVCNIDGTVGMIGMSLSGTAPTVAAGTIGYGSDTQNTVGGAGGAAALPATPVGYFEINVGGTAYVVPYYLKS